MPHIAFEEGRALALKAAQAFHPRTPITVKALFAGRWEQLTTISDAANQIGLHVVIYGERGVGKTSLANIVTPTIWVRDGGELNPHHRLVVKAVASSGDTFSNVWDKLLKEITWQDSKPMIGLVPNKKQRVSLKEAFGLGADLSLDDVRRVIGVLPGAVFIIDEFDRTAKKTSRDFTDLIKALSDFSVDCTLIIVGVSDTVDQLVVDHASISRSLIQINLPRMNPGELRAILTYAENALGVTFESEASNLIVHLSQGLPHYVHLLGLHAVRNAALERFTTDISLEDVREALKLAVSQAEQTVTQKYLKATHSAQRDALYRHVLLATAITAAKSQDQLGYFAPAAVVGPLSTVLGRQVGIATFNNHLSELAQPERGAVLERNGRPRGFRFRFTDPLLVQFIFMNAVTSGLTSDEKLMEVLN